MKHALNTAMARVRAEGKKAAVLGALLLVCAVLGVRAMFTGKRSSAPVAPAPTPGVLAQPAGLGTPTGPVITPGGGALDLSAPVRHARTSGPTRDLFAPDPRWFSDPDALGGAAAQPGAKSADGIDDSSEGSAALQEAARRRRAEEDAAKCRLRSVALGARAVAVIEFEAEGARRGVVVSAGERVAGFTVAEISGAGVRLERDGFVAFLTTPKAKNSK